MKRIFTIIIVLIAMSVQARDVHRLDDLQVNDTFRIQITIPFDKTKCDILDFKQVQKIDVDFKVLSVTKDSIRVAIKPTRWYLCSPAPYNKKLCVYLDTDFHRYHSDNSNPFFYLFDNNSTIASISTVDGGVNVYFHNYSEREQNTTNSRRNWFVNLNELSKGLQISYYKNSWPHIFFDFEKTITQSLIGLAENWNEKSIAGLPWLTNIKSDSKFGLILWQNGGFKDIVKIHDTPAFIQITSASFNLQPNTSVLFSASKDIPEDKIFIQMGDKKIMPVKRINDIYEFKFYLPSPKRASIQDVILDLTPRDSIHVSFNSSTNNYDFKGNGAANSAYINEISKLYNKNTDDSGPNLFTKGEKFHKSTLSVYSGQMNSYWLESAKLSHDYWYASKHIEKYNQKQMKNWGRKFAYRIPWNNKHFTNLFPIGDYPYQPYTYGNLLANSMIHKIQQAELSVMTWIELISIYSPKAFYFAETTFYGYPRSYIQSGILKNLMTNKHLSNSDREYQFFLTQPHDTEIRNSVISLHEKLMKIETEANINETIIDRDSNDPYFIIKKMQDDINNQNPNFDSIGPLVMFLSSLISIVLALLIVRVFIKRRERIKIHILELEMKAVRAQMNPHFTFNALGSIQNLIFRKQDKEASEYLVNFAKLLRMVLSTSEKKLISLSEEIQLLELYLQLEQLRVPFEYTINVDQNIDVENEEIPGMLIQPLVENAVKHGIVPKGGGEIMLNFNIKEYRLYVEIIDSGSGFTDVGQSQKTGFGIASVNERLRLLNKELHLDIDLKIANIVEDGNIKGCKVNLSIPV